MGTRTLVRLAVGICIIGAVTAQYPYNSLHHEQEKDNGPFRPSYYPASQQNQRQQQQNTTPEPEEDKAKFAKIMKQINKVNDDGSYTFGFENDDGSFRVETRTKDGLVKGKYGFVDANGQLKVTEYTAGEKSDEPEGDAELSESEEEGGDFKRPVRPAGPGSRSQPLSARPQPQQQQASRPYYSQQPQPLASRPVPYASAPSYRVPHAFDQAPAAQTTNSKVARAPPTSDDDFNESSEDDSNTFSSRQSSGAGQEDPLNNQYFRSSVTPSGASSAGPRGRFPGAGGSGGISAAGRPLPGQYAAGSPAGPYAQQYSGGFSPAPQYGGFGGPGPQGFPGAGAPPQFGGPSGQFAGSPQDFSGGFPQGAPQGFRRQAPQDFSSIGAPRAGAPQGGPRPNPVQSIQNFGGFEGFNARQGAGKGQQGGSNQGPSDERYVPSVELDGYSEDLDEDGYPDEPPKDGKLKSGASGGAPPSGNFRPQGFPQGGIQSGGAPHRGSPAPTPQVILQLGPGGQILGAGAPGGGAGRFPGGQQGPVGLQGGGGGGIPAHYAPQQNFGGFPQGGGQGFPQGFPQGFEGQGGFQGFPPQQFASSPQGPSGQGQYQSGPSGQGGQYQGGPSGQYQGGPSGNPIQSEGFPYDFSPFGGQGFPQGGQGFPQSYPGGAGGPGTQIQNFGFPGGAGGPQGFPVGAGRFPQGGGGAQGAPGGGSQSYISGGAFPGGQASPTPGSSSEQKKA